MRSSATDDFLDRAVADALLELAVGDRLARPAARRRTPAPSASSRSNAEHVPHGRARPACAAAARGRRRAALGAGFRRGLIRHLLILSAIRLWRTGIDSSALTGSQACTALFDLGELELAARRVDPDAVALAELSLQHAHRQRVEDPPLDRRASAAARHRSDRSPSAMSRSFARSVSSTWILRSSSRFIRPRSWMSMIVRISLARQRVEDDDLVDAVEELRPEVLAQRVHAPRA